ncbi:hypothetical protein L2E82_07943 [Cichorium intybus]|uniref:Uncharacterized protein n=1 Tax=Cichorium intybus TaxID=13427 RepID=A0ACB9G686_CICIN|nr:hypothetical protein L2E82_07943 [Cichorium intybus]
MCRTLYLVFYFFIFFIWVPVMLLLIMKLVKTCKIRFLPLTRILYLSSRFVPLISFVDGQILGLTHVTFTFTSHSIGTPSKFDCNSSTLTVALTFTLLKYSDLVMEEIGRTGNVDKLKIVIDIVAVDFTYVTYMYFIFYSFFS